MSGQPGKQAPNLIHEALATIAVMVLAHMVGSVMGVDDGPRRMATLVMALLMGVWASRTGHWYLLPARRGEAQDEDTDANQGP